ncbi:hypothetical protein PG990_007894 [Apiospora arundinis]
MGRGGRNNRHHSTYGRNPFDNGGNLFSTSGRVTEVFSEDELYRGVDSYRPAPKGPQKVCKFWLNGSCKFGKKCDFAHPPRSLPTHQPKKHHPQPTPKHSTPLFDFGTVFDELHPVPPLDQDGDTHM